MKVFEGMGHHVIVCNRHIHGTEFERNGDDIKLCVEKIQLLETIRVLCKNKQEFKIEQELESYLQKHEHDLDAWLRLAILELFPPLADSEKSIECAEKVLQLSPNHAEAVLLLAYVHHYTLGGVDDELVKRIQSIKTDDPEIRSMLTLAQAWRFQLDDALVYEKLLRESVEQCQTHVWNLAYLGVFYLENGRAEEGRQLILRAINNVQKVYAGDYDDPTDVSEFLNEGYKGNHMTTFNLSYIKKNIDIR